MTTAIVVAAALGALWLLVIAWAAILTSGNRGAGETPIQTTREDGQR